VDIATGADTVRAGLGGSCTTTGGSGAFFCYLVFFDFLPEFCSGSSPCTLLLLSDSTSWISG
jgi:hypothetical protein